LFINQGRVYLVARDNTSVMLGSVFKVPWQQRWSGTSAAGLRCTVPCGRVWSMIHCLLHWEHKTLVLFSSLCLSEQFELWDLWLFTVRARRAGDDDYSESPLVPA